MRSGLVPIVTWAGRQRTKGAAFRGNASIQQPGGMMSNGTQLLGAAIVILAGRAERILSTKLYI
jgi:hypothetical protein